MSTFKEKLAAARLPERIVPICLRGDLVADHEAAERELEQAQKTANDSLAGNGVGPIVDRIEALEAEMREHTHDFRLRALPKPAWRVLVGEHPPRRNEDGSMVDADRSGINSATFYDALIRACLIDPVLDDEDWADLVEALTDRQYDDLADSAWALNRHEVSIPFSRAASRMRRASGDE